MNNFNGQPSGPSRPQTDPPVSLEARFHKAPTWVRWGLICLSGLIFISTAIGLMVLVGASFDQPTVAAAPTQQPVIVPTVTPSPTPSPTPQPIHYPPTTIADLRGLAAKGDASAIHPFHSESVGLTGVCPQPKVQVTVDPSVTSQQLAEDLLAYFYAQKLDNNPCGSVIFADHNQSEAGDAYTAGRILVNVTDSNGAGNVDPNASNLKHQLTLDTGGASTSQESVVTY